MGIILVKPGPSRQKRGISMRKQYGGKLDRTTLHILEAGLFLVLLLFFVIFLLLLQYQHGKDYTYSPMVAISASAVPAIFPPKIPEIGRAHV